MVPNCSFSFDASRLYRFSALILPVCRSLENEIPVSGDPKEPLLHVTYWMFFPYNEGKPVCVLDLGPLGPWPLPLLWGSCLGTWRRFGAHVGDWEHVSLFFSVSPSGDYTGKITFSTFLTFVLLTSW